MRVRNHIRSAVGKLSSHKNLSHDSLITNDFGQLLPVMAVPLLPRDKFRVSTGVFSRVAPMVFPAYGSCDVVTNFHSLTYSQVWKDFDIFVTGQRYSGTTAIYLPTVSLVNIVSLFKRSSYSYEVSSDESYDFRVQNSDSTSTYYRLTLFGRYVRKILTVLGYPFLEFVPTSINSDSHQFNALPLISLFKIYSDYYESRQYSYNSVVREILRECYVGVPSKYFVAWDNTVVYNNYASITLDALSTLFSNYKLLFESDYFTSAQSYPNLVGGTSSLSFNQNGISSPFLQTNDLIQGGTGSSETSQNRYAQSVSSNQVLQTSPMHRILDNFENLIRRFNLVGSREIDRIRSLFGIRPSVASQQYSTFLKSISSPLKVQDVTSTASNPDNDTYLGSYAGKGIISDGSSFTVDSDDFGILIGLSFIRIRPLYNPGLSREVLKTSYTGYYNPEFDHGYSMAVSIGEVQSNQPSLVETDMLFGVFGYQQAYDEYRFQPSRVYGDFLDEYLLPFSFVRENVGTFAQSNNVIYHSQPSMSVSTDSNVQDGMYSEFQRVFTDGSGRDHFYLYYSFNIDALRPVRTSSECFDLGVGDVSTSNNPVI